MVVLALFGRDIKTEQNATQAIEDALDINSTVQVDRSRLPPIFNSAPPGPPPPPVM